MKKKILLILGALALMDLSDIAAKGQFLSTFRRISPDIQEAWNDTEKNMKFPVTVRFKMIDGCAKLWDKVQDVL